MKKHGFLCFFLALLLLLSLAGCGKVSDQQAEEPVKSEENASSDPVLFSEDGFSIAVDGEPWEKKDFDSGVYSWHHRDDTGNFVEVMHMASDLSVDKLIELTASKNNASSYDALELSADVPYERAVSMMKENGYQLDLYFMPVLEDGSYYMVACCFDPANDEMVSTTHEAVFSFSYDPL